MLPVGLLKKSSVPPNVKCPSFPRLAEAAFATSGSSVNCLYAKREAACEFFSASFFSSAVCIDTKMIWPLETKVVENRAEYLSVVHKASDTFFFFEFDLT